MKRDGNYSFQVVGGEEKEKGRSLCVCLGIYAEARLLRRKRRNEGLG